MTNAYASVQGRSHASAFETGIDAGLARVRTAWKQIRSYHHTLTELRALSPRMLRDLNLDGADLRAVAHREVYGN